MNRIPFLAAVSLLTIGTALSALAQSKGDFPIRLGLGYVMPSSDNGSIDIGTANVDPWVFGVSYIFKF